MPRLIPDDGRRDARLVLIREAPDQHEEAQGRPFVGSSGYTLTRWWATAGLSRRDFLATTVIGTRPPQNVIGLVPRAELDDWTRQLHERLTALDDPWLIVPTGNVALRALTGKVGITKHRGSIYEYRDGHGRRIKVIPTLHPAAILRQPAWERRCLADWARIATDATFRELRLPEREHFINPTIQDVEDYLADAQARAEVLVFDVETPKKLVIEQVTNRKGATRTKRSKGARRMTCIGFSFEPHFSMTIPTTDVYWGAELPRAWALIGALLALPCAKGAQNNLFDRWWLAQHGILVTNFVYDTRWMSHALDPLDAHDLGYQASIHTREPYWKDDAKEKNEDAEPDAGDIDTFYRYNGKDNAVTRELVTVHENRLRDAGRTRFYAHTYRRLYDGMLRLSLCGIRVDDTTKAARCAAFRAECVALQAKLAALAGEPLAGKKDLSSKKLTKFLYETLKLPAQRDRVTKGLTAKEVTIRRLMHKHPAVLGRDDEPDMPGPLILRHRRAATLSKFVTETTTDTDGRMHAQWGFTYTLRFTASKTPNGRGGNTQNTDRELLDLLLPDEGCIFLEVDLSQAEDRVVKMLTRAPHLIARARMSPWENDEHRLAASLIFGVEQSRVTKEQRYIGKRARHAGNYGLHGKTFSDALMKDGLLFDADACERMIETILDKDTPEVRDWQRTVRHQILRDRCIATTWGHVLDVTYERLDDALYRKCYAFQPQSEVGLLTKLWGLVPLLTYLEERQIPAQVNNEKHDSLLISTPPQFAWEIANFLRASLERPRQYAGNELTIPVGLKLGSTGAMEIEFKRWPKKQSVTDAAYALLPEH